MQYLSYRDISTLLSHFIPRHISNVSRQVTPVKQTLSVAELAASCFTTIKEDCANMNFR